MKNLSKAALYIPLGMIASKASAQEYISQEQPNILCITFEDSSADLFGCYGGKYAKTPNTDQLATGGLQYMNMWSVAPQSSPARSSLITGCYATSYAMDLHRNEQKTPDGILFPQLLRDAGYYCTNNVKTDYNTSIDNKSCWDECNKTASYNSPQRKQSQPFFAVFNCMTSHMGRIRSFHIDGRRDFSKEGINMQDLVLPPYLPDLPEVRSDYAGHLESIQDIDEWLGYFLKDLEDKNLKDNTIILFYSDHGGCLPRGKGYLFESGLKVPFIVYIPKKWEHLSEQKAGTKTDRLVNFTDVAPTILSLTGIQPPEYMQGKAFLGKYNSPENKYNYALTTNQHHVYMPSRAVSDGRFKYIRRYIPYKYLSLRNYYQWGVPSNMAWDRIVLSNKANDTIIQPYQDQGTELLFDLQADPYEIKNLAGDNRHQRKLEELRKQLSNHIRETKDLGFFIPSSRKDSTNLYKKAHDPSYPLSDLYDLVETASLPKEKDVNYFASYLNHSKNEFRFWASVGLANLASHGKLSNIPSQLKNMVNEPENYVVAEACYAIIVSGNDTNNTALKRLVIPTNGKLRKAGYSLLEVLTLSPFKAQILFEPYVINDLEKSAAKVNLKDNEDAGLIASGILVNLGLLPIEKMYEDKAYELGLAINKGRRKKLPLP